MRLILMRHCKSSWSDLSLSDHDRPLNKRGRISAQALGDWLREQSHAPDLALVSSATRTRETFEGLALECAAEFHPSLYHASQDAVLTQLRKTEAKTVLLIGHNPAIGGCAMRLLAERINHPRFDDFPTGATAVMDFDGEIGWGKANARDFVIPRALLE